MKLLALACQNCSAPLSVPENAKLVTCTHCGTQLAVRVGGGAAYTEMLAAIDARTEQMAEQLDDLQRRTTIAELDRQWETEREQFYVTDKHGARRLPTTGGSIATGLITTVIGGIWTVTTGGAAFAAERNPHHGPPSLFFAIFSLIGVAIIVFGLASAVLSHQKAQAYEQAERRYRQQREELIRRGGE